LQLCTEEFLKLYNTPNRTAGYPEQPISEEWNGMQPMLSSAVTTSDIQVRQNVDVSNQEGAAAEY
jgi:hypothetical protein